MISSLRELFDLLLWFWVLKREKKRKIQRKGEGNVVERVSRRQLRQEKDSRRWKTVVMVENQKKGMKGCAGALMLFEEQTEKSVAVVASNPHHPLSQSQIPFDHSIDLLCGAWKRKQEKKRRKDCPRPAVTEKSGLALE